LHHAHSQTAGPVVRITPNEIHLSDPENYDKIYYVGSKYSKSPNLYNALCIPLSTFGTTANEIHRIRRAALNPMFSRKMVLELEAVVQDKARKVCKLMQEGIKRGTPVDLHHAFRSVSVDVISDFAFDKSYDLLDKADIGAYFFRMVRGLGPAMYTFQQLPSLQALALKTPAWLAPYLSEALGCVTGFQQDCWKQAQVVKDRIAEGKLGDRQTIFSTLLSPEDKPAGYQLPDNEILMQEAYSVLAAAADTTGNTMTTAAFNVLSNPQIYQRLVQELETAFPDPNAKLEFTGLEKLPYLVMHSLTIAGSASQLTVVV
jgi:cytochrome P450